MSECPECMALSDDIDKLTAERDALRAEFEAFKKIFRGKDTYCENCVKYREALEKIAETQDTGGAEGYFGDIARNALGEKPE